MAVGINPTLDDSDIERWLRRVQEQLESLHPFDAAHDVLLNAEEREFVGGRLVASGRLARSLVRAGGEHVWDIQGLQQRIIFGTVVEYARYQREPLFDLITEEDFAEVLTIALDTLLRDAQM